MGLETENKETGTGNSKTPTPTTLLILPKQVHQLGPRIQMCEPMGAFSFKAPHLPICQQGVRDSLNLKLTVLAGLASRVPDLPISAPQRWDYRYMEPCPASLPCVLGVSTQGFHTDAFIH